MQHHKVVRVVHDEPGYGYEPPAPAPVHEKVIEFVSHGGYSAPAPAPQPLKIVNVSFFDTSLNIFGYS